MAIEVNTSDYVRSHGRAPRGYGQWAFFFDHKKDVDDAQWFTGKYGEAKKMAITYAVTFKHSRIDVGA